MSSYLFIPHIFIGDLSLYCRLEILSGRKHSVPYRSSQKQSASFPLNIHLHFVLGKELDHICQPILQDSHVAGSFHWGVAGAGKREPPAGYGQTLGGCRHEMAGAWVSESLHGTEVPLARRTHLGCFLSKKYSFGGLSYYAFGKLFVFAAYPILINKLKT